MRSTLNNPNYEGVGLGFIANSQKSLFQKQSVLFREVCLTQETLFNRPCLSYELLSFRLVTSSAHELLYPAT
jgi:hypothetical protein